MRNILVVWEIVSEKDNVIYLMAYNYYFSLQEAMDDFDNFPEKYIIRIGKEDNYWWTGWFN